MADTFGKRQRAMRKKERQQNKKDRKADRAASGNPGMSEEEIARDYFDIDPEEDGESKDDKDSSQ